MIYLATNTANQLLYLSLDEGRQYFSTAFTHYLMILTREENSTTGQDLAQVVDIVSENTRYTEIEITTVGLTFAGRYRYEVYGQNSASNTDPNNAAVVGLVQRGYAVLSDGQSDRVIPEITIPDSVIYNG